MSKFRGLSNRRFVTVPSDEFRAGFWEGQPDQRVTGAESQGSWRIRPARHWRPYAPAPLPIPTRCAATNRQSLGAPRSATAAWWPAMSSTSPTAHGPGGAGGSP